MNREEAQRRSDEALDALTQALAAGKGPELVAYLEMIGRFHQYSFGNCMLIALQRPEATHVAGFRRWKQLGRHVKKGGSGIAILAPLVYRPKAEEGAPAGEPEDEPTKARSLRGFRVVCVFDVSQTEGQELPELAMTITGDPGEHCVRLEQLIRGRGFELKFEAILGGAKGVSSGGLITVEPDLPPAETFAELVHELAHELLHKAERRKETTKSIRETEAEAVAFVVCKAVGLDGLARSADYIQLWAGDKELLLQSLDLIQKTAAGILGDLHGVEPEEVPHAA